jgi:hypothetical protein
MTDELSPQPSPLDPSESSNDSDDPGTELVADIESRLQAQFPDLERRPEVIQTIETVLRERSFCFQGLIHRPKCLPNMSGSVQAGVFVS